MGLLRIFRKQKDIKVTYIDMSRRKSLAASFYVRGTFKEEAINEKVSINKITLSDYLEQELSDYEYLSEILEMRDNFNNTKYGDFFFDLAYEQHTKRDEKFETFKMILELSSDNEDVLNKRPIGEVYNKGGRLVKPSVKDMKSEYEYR